ncbi:MAG: beta-lactamase family protein [Planctomycetota bacterium]|nr:beta-lactamase family protein [Planctomycetota bacterium]
MKSESYLARLRALGLCLAIILSFIPSKASADAVVDRFAAIAGKMQPFVDKGDVSGIVTLVADKEKVLHLAAVGKSNLDTGRGMKTDDLFWIASMSKPMTAACVAMLVDEGKLSFDDPVEKYLPQFHNQWVITESAADHRTLAKAAHPITLRNLLTHTSGMGEYVVTDPHWTLAEMAIASAREPLRFQSGSKWGYSTAGIDALGRVVEVVSGMPFDKFIQTRLFEPLGMKNTTFWISSGQEERYVQPYKINAQTGKLEDAVITYMYGGAITDHARPPLGGAGLFSTAEDVARFYQMMLNQGSWDGHKILKPETVAEMTKVQIGQLTARPGMPWGLGFCIIADPKGITANETYSAGSFGHGGAFGTHSWADPASGLIYVMMLERSGLKGGDNSDEHIAFQQAAAAALGK